MQAQMWAMNDAVGETPRPVRVLPRLTPGHHEQRANATDAASTGDRCPIPDGPQVARCENPMLLDFLAAMLRVGQGPCGAGP